MSVETDQSLPDLHVDECRGDSFVERGERPAGEAAVSECLLQCDMQCVATEMVVRLRVGTSLQQFFNERQIAGGGGRHQGRVVHEGAVIDAIAIAVL